MKPSERILALCAVVLTVVVILAWLRFDSAEYRATSSPAIAAGDFTNQIRRINSQRTPLGN